MAHNQREKYAAITDYNVWNCHQTARRGHELIVYSIEDHTTATRPGKYWNWIPTGWDKFGNYPHRTEIVV